MSKKIVKNVSKYGWVSFLSDCFSEIETTGFRVAKVTFYDNKMATSTLPTLEDMITNLPDQGELTDKPILPPEHFSAEAQAIIDNAWEVLQKLQDGKKEGTQRLLCWGAEVVKDVSDVLHEGHPLRVTFRGDDGSQLEIFG